MSTLICCDRGKFGQILPQKGNVFLELFGKISIIKYDTRDKKLLPSISKNMK